jgi:hypothetical protein
VAILAGMVWVVLFGLAVQGWENGTTRYVRTSAFVVMIAAGSLYPLKRDEKKVDEEDT